MSVLRHALLGLLAREPMTGYQLSRALERTIGYFWHANHSQVYPQLKALSEAGLARPEALAGPGPRENKRFHLSDLGRAELRSWLSRPVKLGPDRDEFVVRVYSIWLLDPDDAVRIVTEHRQLHADRLAEYQSIRQALGEPTEPSDPQFAQRATLQAGLGYSQHRIAWSDWMLDRLRPG
ncbi:MAG: PadR family transcriptional regulator [Propionibacteriaceae bacterium]